MYGFLTWVNRRERFCCQLQTRLKNYSLTTKSQTVGVSLFIYSRMVSTLRHLSARILTTFYLGGCFQFITLSDLLHSRPSLHLAMPSAIVFDSCPVRYEVSSVRRLASVFLPDFPLHFRLDALALVTLAVLVQVRIAWAQLGPFNSPCGDLLATQWDRLHQTNLYPWFTKDTKRLYLYSRVDPVTSQAVVEEHMEDARKHGLHVDKVLFDESLHIFHLKKYPEQYWGAVKRVWDDASVLSGRQHKL